MINWGRISELREEIGEDDFSEVVELFLEEVEGVMEILDTDPAELGARLHFLRGSAWNLGFGQFGDLCHAGEKLCALGLMDEVDLLALRGVYLASREEFLARA